MKRMAPFLPLLLFVKRYESIRFETETIIYVALCFTELSVDRVRRPFSWE